MQVALTVGIFALTLVLVLIRPRGLSEAWFTVGGGLLMLAFRLESPAQAVQIVVQGKEALLFLVGLLVLADMMKASGFFDWAAIHAARVANGNGHALYRNVFLLGAAITILLSLDTTAVMLTPVVMAFVRRLKLKPLPFLFACAFVANTGSLLLQISNLTNLLFAGAFHWTFLSFTKWMVLPQVAALAANYLAFRWLFRSSLPAQFSAQDLPSAKETIHDRGFFKAAVAIFVAVVSGYFVGAAFKIPPYVFAISGACLLLGIGIQRKRVHFSQMREISWSVFPFVIGLFVVVGALENLGLSGLVRSAIDASALSKLLTVLTAVFGAGIGSNVVNNIPMALLSITSLRTGSDLARYAALIGCNLGPNLTVAGSLATMLVITTARKEGENVGAKDFFKVGLKTTPILLTVSALALWLTSAFLK